MTWSTAASRAFTSKVGIQHPIVLAPMAGACTPALVAAVSGNGGLGMYGAALMPAPDLKKVVQTIKAAVPPGKPWGINLFCPPPDVPPFTQQQCRALQHVHEYYNTTAAQHALQCRLETNLDVDLQAAHSNLEAQIQV